MLRPSGTGAAVNLAPAVGKMHNANCDKKASFVWADVFRAFLRPAPSRPDKRYCEAQLCCIPTRAASMTQLLKSSRVSR